MMATKLAVRTDTTAITVRTATPEMVKLLTEMVIVAVMAVAMETAVVTDSVSKVAAGTGRIATPTPLN